MGHAHRRLKRNAHARRSVQHNGVEHRADLFYKHAQRCRQDMSAGVRSRDHIQVAVHRAFHHGLAGFAAAVQHVLHVVHSLAVYARDIIHAAQAGIQLHKQNTPAARGKLGPQQHSYRAFAGAAFARGDHDHIRAHVVPFPKIHTQGLYPTLLLSISQKSCLYNKIFWHIHRKKPISRRLFCCAALFCLPRVHL